MLLQSLCVHATLGLQARMRGRYLMHKVEMLLSFYLLAPLWGAVAYVLQQVGQHADQQAGQRSFCAPAE